MQSVSPPKLFLFRGVLLFCLQDLGSVSLQDSKEEEAIKRSRISNRGNEFTHDLGLDCFFECIVVNLY